MPVPRLGSAADCARLHDALPAKVAAQGRRQTKPVDDRTAAWGDPAIVLRCGVARPRALGAGGSQPITVNGKVQWLQQVGRDSLVLTAVDRTVFVEVTVPNRYSGAAVAVDLTDAVASLPERPAVTATPAPSPSPP